MYRYCTNILGHVSGRSSRPQEYFAGNLQGYQGPQLNINSKLIPGPQEYFAGNLHGYQGPQLNINSTLITGPK